MAIPKFEKFFYPFLLLLRDRDVKKDEIKEALIKQFNLTDEERKLKTKSGTYYVIDSHLGWVRQYLRRALFIVISQRGTYRITQRGKEYLIGHTDLTVNDLLKYSEFQEYFYGGKGTNRRKKEKVAPSQPPKEKVKHEKPGYVYILTNPSFREDWVKIGMTQNMEERLRTLDTTALPLPFKKYATMKTVKYKAAEKHVHHYIERFTDLRIRDNREFFNITPEEALSIFYDVAELLDDAEIVVYDKEASKPKSVDCPSSDKPKSKGQLFNMEYWNAFVEYMKQNPSELFHTPSKGSYDHWITIAIGRSGFQVDLLLNKREQRATIQLWMPNDREKKQFDALVPYKEQAESSIGQKLDWRRMNDSKASTIALYLNNCGITDSTKWNTIFAWYREYTEKYVEFFKPIIKTL
ncbi:MAG: DUF4268 domain-containing protein [Bacteroidaceae bacterium]|nr:DUF4268 domain-containing protein [Bacteroidaceae bacterium]